MIEVYLFVNPLDKKSLNVEQKYFNIIKKETKKIQFRMIPFVNPKVINDFLATNHISFHDLDYRNELMTSVYSSCLDCKAAYLQGRKKGRQFLFELQKRVNLKDNPYSEKMVYSILNDLRLDIPVFYSDRDSELVADFVKLDQRVANEMGVEHFAESVIFNYDSNRDFGVLVDSETPEPVIIELFKSDSIKKHFSANNDVIHLYKKG